MGRLCHDSRSILAALLLAAAAPARPAPPPVAPPAAAGPHGDLRTDGAAVLLGPGKPVTVKIDRLEVRLGADPHPYELVEIAYHDRTDIADALAFDGRYAWFVSSWGDREIRIDPETLELTEYGLPRGCGPRSIAIDGEGTHWLICLRAEVLLEVWPGEGKGKVHRPTVPGFMNFIVADSAHKRIWVGRPSHNAIARFERGAGFRQYAVPTADGGPGLADVDGKGHLWFPLLYGNKLVRFDPERETFEEFPLPTGNALPVASMVDSRGGVWTSEHMQDRLAVLRDNRFDEYQIPTSNSGVNAMAEAPDGHIWFAEGGWRGSLGSNRIGRLDPRTRKVDEIELPTPSSQPVGLSIDRQGRVWFVEMGTGKIALLRRMAPARPAPKAAVKKGAEP